MFKKYLTLILAVLVINLSFSATAFAGTTVEKIAKQSEKVKANIARLGTGKDARVEIKLRDNTKLKGYVSQINENNFVVVNDKTGNASEVPYANAKQVKGNNLSTGVKIAIGVVVVLVIAALVGAYSPD
jgi:sensor histidine kinase regulating citrate/malate metabolism